MMFISVDFPEPEAPMIATNSPCSTLSETPRSACTAKSPAPYVLTMRRRSMTGCTVRSGATVLIRPAARSRRRRSRRRRTVLLRRSSCELDVAALTVTVGSTRTWPSRTPLKICVVEAPTSPVVTVVTVFLPFARTVTVETGPVVVIAALGTSRTFERRLT